MPGAIIKLRRIEDELRGILCDISEFDLNQMIAKLELAAENCNVVATVMAELREAL